jgi:hypothetical protein
MYLSGAKEDPAHEPTKRYMTHQNTQALVSGRVAL